MIGSRSGPTTHLRRLVARAMARTPAVFVIPDARLARAAGLDLRAAGVTPAATPRHASVLLVVGDLPAGLRAAAAVVYAQMPRPRAILALGADTVAPLPRADVVATLDQRGLVEGLTRIRYAVAAGAWSERVEPFTAEVLEAAAMDGGGMDHTAHAHGGHAMTGAGEHTGHGAHAGHGADDGMEHDAHADMTHGDHAGMDHGGHGGHQMSGGRVGHGGEAPSHGDHRGSAGHDHHRDDRSDAGDEHSGHAGVDHGNHATMGHGSHAGMDRGKRAPGPDNAHASMNRGTPTDLGRTDAPHDTLADMDHAPHRHHGSGDHAGHGTPGERDQSTYGAHADHGGRGRHGRHVEPAGESDAAPDDHEGHRHGHPERHATADHDRHGGMERGDHDAMSHSEHDAHAGDADQTHRHHDEHATMNHGEHAERATVGHGDHVGMDHGSHAGMDHGAMGHDMAAHDHHMMDGGFMSMVAMTQDLPRSRDGLPMEWTETAFGPLFPGLPAGLAVMLTLDGDTVAAAELDAGHVHRDIVTSLSGPAATLADRLAALDPLAPVAYRVLAAKALAAVQGPDGPDTVDRAGIGAVERERATSHLAWLAAFLDLLGAAALAERAVRLQLKAVQASDIATMHGLRPKIERLLRDVARTPLLGPRTAGIGRLAPDAVRHASGPVARASGQPTDARAESAAYRALGFAPVTRERGDVHARLQVRLAEIRQSLDLIAASRTIAPTVLAVPAHVSGSGMATVETPRGTASLHVVAHHGQIHQAHLGTPSDALRQVVPAVTDQAELADALVAIASLDLSPWEIDT